MRQQLLKASKILQNNEGIDGKELGTEKMSLEFNGKLLGFSFGNSEF
jgi:hypothetical protein